MRLGLIKFSSYYLQFARFKASISNVNKVYRKNVRCLCSSVGPLLYHFADMSDELSIEFGYEELCSVIEKIGFRIIVR